MNKSTRDWLDLYDMMLDRLAEFLKDPVKFALAQGITKEELAKQASIAQLPGKMDLDRHKELISSWKQVRTSIQLFGLELGEDLEIGPHECMDPDTPAFQKWLRNPVLEVSRGIGKPLTFRGRDALTALGFLNMYIQQCATVDPSVKIKQTLEAQGITKENFHEHVGASGIRSPWENEPNQPEKG